MKKMWKITAALLLALVLCGCTPTSETETKKPASRVVVRIEVDGLHGEEVIRRRYESQENMGAILNYLRPLRSLGPADRDPERLAGDVYEIRIWRYDGERDIYRLRSDRYLSKNCEPWQNVVQKQAQRLYPLLLELESEAAAPPLPSHIG